MSCCARWYPRGGTRGTRGTRDCQAGALFVLGRSLSLRLSFLSRLSFTLLLHSPPSLFSFTLLLHSPPSLLSLLLLEARMSVESHESGHGGKRKRLDKPALILAASMQKKPLLVRKLATEFMRECSEYDGALPLIYEVANSGSTHSLIELVRVFAEASFLPHIKMLGVNNKNDVYMAAVQGLLCSTRIPEPKECVWKYLLGYCAANWAVELERRRKKGIAVDLLSPAVKKGWAGAVVALVELHFTDQVFLERATRRISDETSIPSLVAISHAIACTKNSAEFCLGIVSAEGNDVLSLLSKEPPEGSDSLIANFFAAQRRVTNWAWSLGCLSCTSAESEILTKQGAQPIGEVGDGQLLHKADLLRRHYKKCICKHVRWPMVWDAVCVRPYVLHWMEDHQRRICAPGGEGRREDRAAYEADEEQRRRRM